MKLSIRHVVACTTLSFCSTVASPALAQSYTHPVLAQNPLLYWDFNEAGDTDEVRSMSWPSTISRANRWAT